MPDLSPKPTAYAVHLAPDNTHLRTPSRNSPNTLVALLAIGLAVQMALWALSGGYLSSKAGDDDSGYIFLALEIMGQMDEPPLFDIRAPGWPATIAAILSVTGTKNMWVLGFAMRLALSLWPLLAYHVLKLSMKESTAFVLSLLSLLLPINRYRAEVAVVDVFYVTAVLLSLCLTCVSIYRHLSWRWCLLSGIALSYTVLLRLDIAPVVLFLAIGMVLGFGVDRRPTLHRRLVAAALIALPTTIAVAAWGMYNRSMLGEFSLVQLAAPSLSTQFAVHADSVPTTPETMQLRQLLPELQPADHVLFHWHDWYVGRYRAAEEIGVREYDKLVSKVGAQRVQSNLDSYTIWALENTLYALLFPLPSPSWLPTIAESRDYTETEFNQPGGLGRMQFSLGHRVSLSSDTKFTRIWHESRFSLFEPPAFMKTIRLLNEPFYFLFLPLWSGWIGLAAISLLLLRPSTRAVGLVFLAFYVTINLGVVLFAVRQIRYLYFSQPIVLLALMMLVGKYMPRVGSTVSPR